MPRFYTRKGDDGTSSLLGATRIQKDNIIFSTVGDIDELNSIMGVARFYIHNDLLRGKIKKVQNDLFTIGAMLASMEKPEIKGALSFGDERVKWLEDSIEEMSEKIPELNKFVLPGGSEGSVHLHLARAVARRAERSVVKAANEYKEKVSPVIVKYINRLSSFLFVAALYLNRIEGIEEEHPEY